MERMNTLDRQLLSVEGEIKVLGRAVSVAPQNQTLRLLLQEAEAAKASLLRRKRQIENISS